MRTFSILLLLYPLMVFAQPAFRPIIDSTVTCAYEKGSTVISTFDPEAPDKVHKEVHLEVFYIVEQMPVPEIEPDKVAMELSKSVQMNEREKEATGAMFFQCVINCEGKAGDFQIIDCPDGMANVCFQVFDMTRKMMEGWQPGKQHDRSVDVLIMIKVALIDGEFEFVAPVV